MNKSIKLKQNGFALPLVLVAVIVLLTLGTGLLTVGLNGRIYSMQDTAEITARCSADAGLTEALYEMNQLLLTKPWDDSTLPSGRNIFTNDSEYNYIVTTNLGGEYVITSIGQSDSAAKMVQASMQLAGIFDQAILTKDSLILKAGTIIDGYNSNDPSDSDIDLTIGTQSTDEDVIVLNNGVTVKGNVSIGKGGNPDTAIKDLGATIEGGKNASTLTIPLPVITPPDDLTETKASITAKSTTVNITPAESGVYTDISLQNGKTPGVLNISGGDVVLYVTGDIDLGQSCEIIVEAGATLTLFIDGDIVSDNSSSISTTASPEEATTITIYGTGDDTQSLDLKAKGDWTGRVYAPDAEVGIYAQGDMYGSIVADSLEIKNSGTFHYDEALRDVDENDLGVRFVIARWSESPVVVSQAYDVEEALVELAEL